MGGHEESDYPWRNGPYGPHGEGWRTPERGYIPGAEGPDDEVPYIGGFHPGRPRADAPRDGDNASRGRRDGSGDARDERSSGPRYDDPRLGGGRGLDDWLDDNLDEPDRYKHHPILGPRRRSERSGRSGNDDRRSATG